MFWGNSCCKNYKRITLQNKFPGLFSCKKGHTSGSNITKKIFWWNYFVIITKKITKIMVPGNYFVIISAMMVLSGRKKAHKHKLFALVNVEMALGQTAGCPRVNQPGQKVYVFASKHRKYKLFPLVIRRVVPGLSRLSKSLYVQSLCAFFLPYIK